MTEGRPAQWPAWANDSIYTNTSVKFGFMDRVRLMLRGEVTVKTVTAVEHQTTRTNTYETKVLVRPIFPDSTEFCGEQEASR